MKYILKHNTKDYIIGNMLLWFWKFLKRTYQQRILLTVLIFLILISFALISYKIAVYFSIVVVSIITIDFIISFVEALKSFKKTNKYIIEGGDNIHITTDKYFAYIIDNKEYYVTFWNDMYEIIRINKPSLISFKSRQGKFVITIFESEIPYGFQELKNQILSNAKVKPLL